MVDIENQVFNAVATELRSRHSGVYVVGEYLDTPPKFPAVTLMEMSNTVVDFMETAKDIERGVRVMYEANVYSNKTVGKKAEAKSIMSTLDAKMKALGFRRSVLTPVPNYNDATIYRITARYEAVVSLRDGHYYIFTN